MINKISQIILFYYKQLNISFSLGKFILSCFTIYRS